MEPRDPDHPTLPASLILLRHGEVARVHRDRLYGGADVPLSSRGQAGSVRLARRLDDLAIAAVHTSDLERTRFLARELARDRATDIIEHASLREIERGDWSGRRRADVYAEAGWRDYCDDPDHYAGHGAETGAQFMSRIRGALDDIVTGPVHRPLVVVCHRHVVCAALALVLGVPFKTALKFQVDYLGATVIEWPDPGQASGRQTAGEVHLVNGTADAVCRLFGAHS